jgi:hypothetical protein
MAAIDTGLKSHHRLRNVLYRNGMAQECRRWAYVDRPASRVPEELRQTPGSMGN